MLLCVPVLNQFDLLHKCILSALEGTVRPELIVILDNSAGKLQLEIDIDVDINLYIPPANLGVAASFNFFLRLGYEQYPDKDVLIANDDLIFAPNTIELFQRAMREYPDELIYCTGGGTLEPLNAFSLFSARPKRLIETVGYFETIYYSYYEDNDMVRRMNSLGYELFRIQGCSVAEHIGSATLKAYTPDEELEHHRMFAEGTQAYIRKWGGMPGQETFQTAYNLPIDN